MPNIPELPVLDEELIRSAIFTADGTRCHNMHAEIGSYRNSVIFAQSLARSIRDRGPVADDLECLNARIEAARKYEAILRQRLVAARLAGILAS